MHMSDALLVPAVAATMYAASGVTAGISVKKLNDEDPISKIPVMGVMSAFVFAGQMINYTIPGTGSSGHICGSMLLTSVLGPYAGFLSMVVILLIQALLFADGGLMALGANVWNMAFYGCFIGYFLIYRPIVEKRLFGGNMTEGGPDHACRAGRMGRDGLHNSAQKYIVFASVAGCILTLQLGAFSVCLETTASGITDLPFSAFVMLMQPIHLAIGLIEGLVTSAVLVFVYKTRPDILFRSDRDAALIHAGSEDTAVQTGKWSRRKVLLVLGCAALVLGGAVSLFASASPDGLEWSMERLAGAAKEGISFIQEKTALLPDYSFRSNADSAAGTSFSGIVGSLVVAAFACALYALCRFIQRHIPALRGRGKNSSAA